MSFQDTPPVRGLASGGQIGTIPDDVYFKKIAVSEDQIDPYMVENHIRALMMDFRPDAPFFASDEIRRSDDPHGGTHGKELLALRHSGARTEEYPDLPDGLFLDFEFAERDPRGHAVDPNMRKMYEQQMDRAAFIKLYDDSDFSVPESGVNPQEMVRRKTAGFYPYKDRTKIFEESFDSWHNGGTGKTLRKSSGLENLTLDGTIVDIADASVTNRADPISRLSADPTISYRYSTPDHKFKISRYDNVRPGQQLMSQNWYDNRAQSHLGHLPPVSINGVLVNRMLANAIVDLQGQRESKQATTDYDQFGQSTGAIQSKKKLRPDDILKILLIQGSQDPTSNELLGGYLKNTSRQIRTDAFTAQRRPTINHDIIESMKSIQRKGVNKADIKEARKHIEQSAVDVGVYIDQKNPIAASKRRINNGLSDVDNHFADTVPMVNYKQVAPKTQTRRDVVSYEDYKKESMADASRRLVTKSKGINVDTYQMGTGLPSEFSDYTRANRADKSTHIAKPIFTENDLEVEEYREINNPQHKTTSTRLPF